MMLSPAGPLPPRRPRPPAGARAEVGEFGTYLLLPSRAGRSGPGASIFYGVRGEKSRSLEHICRFPAESTAGKLGELEHIRCSPAKSPPEHGKLPVFAVRFWNVKKLCSKSVVFYFQEYKNHLFLGG